MKLPLSLSVPGGFSQGIRDWLVDQTIDAMVGKVATLCAFRLARDPAEWHRSAMSVYQGGCHCGRVRFEVNAELEGVLDCNCSICKKKGFLHWIVPKQAFSLLSGGDALTDYRFNTGVARHLFCSRCGMHPFYVPRSDPDKIDVNVRCLDGVELAALPVRPFDGTNWERAQAERVATTSDT